MEIETQSLILTPYENFLYAMKAQETKRQYPHRLDKFLTFMNLQGTIQEKCARLYETANKDINLFQSNIIRFINFQKERIGRGEISFGQSNYGYRYSLNISSPSKFLNSFSGLPQIGSFLTAIPEGYNVPYKGMLILTEKQDGLYAIVFLSPKENFDSALPIKNLNYTIIISF